MKTFTVIGMYEALSEEPFRVFAEQVEAESGHEAMRIISGVRDDPYNLQIIGAIEGAHAMLAPCEDSGTAATALDLIERAEEFTRAACGRPEGECSKNPCADVIADRKATIYDESGFGSGAKL